MELTEQKKKIRLKVKARRQDLTLHEVMKSSRKIVEKLETLLDWSEVSTLHSYLAIKNNNEPDPVAFLAWLYTEYPDTQQYSWLNWQEFPPSHKSLGSTEHIPEEFDVILVPCMAADTQGNRLGYGRGIYDKFLNKQKGTTICLCFEDDIQEKLPNEIHDKSVDFIVTEKLVTKLN